MKENKYLLRGLQIAFVLLFTISTILYTLQLQILNANLYKNALLSGNVYAVTEDIVIEKTTNLVVDLQNQLINILLATNQEQPSFINSALVYGLNIVFETQTGKLIDEVFLRLQIQELMQRAVETGIDRDIAWLKGQRDSAKIFEYIPSTEKLDNFKQTSFNDLINQALFEFLKRNNITECTTQEAITENINLIKQGGAPKLTCISPEMVGLIRTGAEYVIPDETEQTLQTPFESLVTNNKYEQLITDIYNSIYTVAEFKERAIGARYTLSLMKMFGAVGLGISAVLLVSIAFVAKKKYIIKNIAYTTFGAGAFTLLVLSVYYISLSIFLLRGGMYNSFNIQSEILSSTQSLLIAESLNKTTVYLLKHLPFYTLVVAVITTVVSAIVIFIQRILSLNSVQTKINKAKKDTKDYISKTRKDLSFKKNKDKKKK